MQDEKKFEKITEKRWKNWKNKQDQRLNCSGPAKKYVWLGWCDSNTRISESESEALPLGDIPK